jgi:predicted nucleic acid-binding protein
VVAAEEVVVLDSDVLSELSRGKPRVLSLSRRYLAVHGRLTITAVSVFERLRGYRAAIAAGKPYEAYLRQFELFVATCVVLPLDARAADRAATIWAALHRRRSALLGDVLIAAIAASSGLPVVTHNKRDFKAMAAADADVRIADWRV